jgi:hypothetical protein
MQENLMTQAEMDKAVLEKAYAKEGSQRRVVITPAEVDLSRMISNVLPGSTLKHFLRKSTLP